MLLLRILLSIRETGGDWIDGQHGRGDPILKGEKDPKTGPSIKIPDRNVGPSSTQVCTFDASFMHSWSGYQEEKGEMGSKTNNNVV